jgi:hypothetical protein
MRALQKNKSLKNKDSLGSFGLRDSGFVDGRGHSEDTKSYRMAGQDPLIRRM